MDRTAEEFVEQLPDGSWAIADDPGMLGIDDVRQEGAPRKLAFYLMKRGTFAILTLEEAQDSRYVVKYSSKRSCKRAAQRMLEAFLDGKVV